MKSVKSDVPGLPDIMGLVGAHCTVHSKNGLRVSE